MPDVTREVTIMRPPRDPIGKFELRYIKVPAGWQGDLLLAKTDVAGDPYPSVRFIKHMHGTTSSGPPFTQPNDFFQFTFSDPRDIRYGSASTKVFKDPSESSVAYFYTSPDGKADWWGREEYKGGFYPPLHLSPGLTLGESEDLLYNPLTPSAGYVHQGSLQDLGNRGYAKLRPKVEKAALFQSLVELREAPAMLRNTGQYLHRNYLRLQREAMATTLWRPSTMRRNRGLLDLPKEQADEFLNQKFGWAPFVKDVNDMCDVVINFDKHVDDAVANNGVWTRRRFTEPIQESETLVDQSTGLSSFCYPSLGERHVTKGSYTLKRQRMTRLWYTGRFMSYYPEFDREKLKTGYSELTRLRQFLRLSGLEISPTTLYRVTPWTWLVDWFSGAGDYVQRVNDMVSDQVVSDKFCIMRRAYDRLEYQSVFTDHAGTTNMLTWYRSMEVKRREVARGLFSFSAAPSGLTDKQWAILGALGLSALGSRP